MTSMLSSFRVLVEPMEGGTYEEMAALARRAEVLGFGGFFRADHYHPINVSPESDATDCWAVLAGLARDTKTIRLGSLVSPMTFRHPSEFAKVVATVDHMSGGRIEVGMGAGWFEKEHVAYGFPFPSPGERLDLLEESLEVCTRLWADGPATYDGKLFQLHEAPGYPKPAQRPRPPIILGGGGPKRTPALAARFADEFNVSARPHLETFVGDAERLFRQAAAGARRLPADRSRSGNGLLLLDKPHHRRDRRSGCSTPEPAATELHQPARRGRRLDRTHALVRHAGRDGRPGR